MEHLPKFGQVECLKFVPLESDNVSSRVLSPVRTYLHPGVRGSNDPFTYIQGCLEWLSVYACGGDKTRAVYCCAAKG